jgi:hypothetical protein
MRQERATATEIPERERKGRSERDKEKISAGLFNP